MGWIDRRYAATLDKTLMAAMLALSLIGIVTIHSASITYGSVSYDLSQWRALAVGLAAMLIVLLLPYTRLVALAPLFYGLLLVCLVAVLYMPAEAGVHRWLRLGPIGFQPSEFAKVGVVLMLARSLQETRQHRLSFLLILIAVLLVALPGLLILKEPSLGTAAVLGPILVGLLFICGLSWKLLVGCGLAGVAGVLVVYSFFLEKLLKPYQIARIRAFLEGTSYQVVQSRIGIGSGGLFGKGYLHSTQARLNFVPEHHTDFIFSVFAEEWGFAGCLLLFGIYLVLIWRGLMAAREATRMSGTILAAGCTLIVATQLIVNVAMVVGLLPVTGLPLPFLTYGGSNTVMTMIALGLILNVGMRRFEEYGSTY